jgi:hypothetical protein
LFAPTGSVIEFVPPEAKPPAPPAPLQGTFDVVPTNPAPPNSGFAFNITRLAFSGGGYAVSGSAGHIETTSLDLGNPLIFTVTVMINGMGVQLAGGGDRTTFTNDSPPTFTTADLRGDYYHLRLSAVPLPAARPGSTCESSFLLLQVAFERAMGLGAHGILSPLSALR